MWSKLKRATTSSQEEMLNNAPHVPLNLALGSERMSSSEDEEAPETLVMMSVSESSAEVEEEEYQTPPERHSHTLTCSNEARIDCGGRHEDVEKAVDLSRDSEVFDSEYYRLNAPPSSVVRLDEDVKEMEEDGGGEKCIEDDAMDGDLMMEEGGAPSNASCGADTSVVEPVVDGNHGSSANADIEFGVGSGGVRAGEVNELQCIDKGIVEEVERIRLPATSVCVSDNASSKVRKLPSSFCTGNKGEDGPTGNDRGSCRVRTDKRYGVVETGQVGSSVVICRGNSSAGAIKGINERGVGDASGKKPSQTKEVEEPNEDELTENILKVLGLLAKPQRPVYKEKVDIVGSAIKAGITFPRPSWWPEDSDDDSS